MFIFIVFGGMLILMIFFICFFESGKLGVWLSVFMRIMFVVMMLLVFIVNFLVLKVMNLLLKFFFMIFFILLSVG